MRCPFFILSLFHCFVFAQESVYSPENSDLVLVLTAKGGIFDQAVNGLVNELRDDFSISIAEINEKTSIEDLDTLFKVDNLPKVAVLVGNNAIRHYQKYHHQNKEKTESIQVVSFLALDVERAVSGFAKVNAIAYETPMVTALVNFRRVINKPLSKVGVIYRKPYKDFIDKYSVFCKREKFEIKGIEIGTDTSKHQMEIDKALNTFLSKDSVEAIWVTNDNLLLKPDYLSQVWLPTLKKKKIPLIVGVEALANPKLNFGTFAVIPDPAALGAQAAEIIFDLKTEDWDYNETTIHPAISMYSVLNLKKATEISDKKDLKIYEVSKVLK